MSPFIMKPTSGYALWQMEAIGDSLIREEEERIEKLVW